MAKSATVIRDDKPGATPGKSLDKAPKSGGKPESPGGSLAAFGTGKPLTGIVTRSADFLKDVRGEMRKVVTPSKEEVRSMTTVVIVTVFAIAAYFYIVDAVLGHTIQALLRFLGGAQ